MTFDRVRISTPMLVIVFLLSFFFTARAADIIPPVPPKYFNDNANVVSPPVADSLNRQLEQFERDTSNQVRVVIYPKMQSDSDIAQYTTEVFHKWKIGQKGKDNGVVLFVFVADRKLRIVTGYGLEGALPDALCKRIIDETIVPLLKTGDYDGAMRGGVAGIIAATRGEYKGTGKTNEELGGRFGGNWSWLLAAIAAFVLFGILLFILHNFGGTFYQNHVRSLSFLENIYLCILQIAFSMIGSGGSSSSGGGGDGGFASSGGGDTGGGGAGGSW